MLLDKDTFSTVIQNTPLISIDLIVENKKGQILLGKRVNEPALGYWFVPGGRIFKDESLDDAFSRTVRDELGLALKRSDAVFDKTYEHFYKNNVFDDKFCTHYVVLAHKIKIDKLPMLNNQHSDYKWFEVDELLQNKNVHKYTKDYFR
ncbi:MAG: GDP-mannose mannosyl hydrolase [Candidatus Pacebacteria bacterium]|jgi:colanic acid biosynthesis protein WcaH|nr:GDP-mannose mannosyl hydrolase [Candidatus Paceibacterota bacterium]